MYPFTLFPLGDSALTLSFGGKVDERINRLVVAVAARLEQAQLPGVTELAFAYSSITVFYHIPAVPRIPAMPLAYQSMEYRIRNILDAFVWDDQPQPSAVIKEIPVWYGGPDLAYVSHTTGLSTEAVMALHSTRVYRVFFLGFLPGFAYMGGIDPRLAVPRKSDSVPVRAGSVGLAGQQTGIYPVASPGGWHVIGYTPFAMYDKKRDKPCYLQAGDVVQFCPVSKSAYEHQHT